MFIIMHNAQDFVEPPLPTHTHTQSLATMLSVIPLAARGPTQIFIFDIHSLQERFYFSDQVIPRCVCEQRRVVFFSIPVLFYPLNLLLSFPFPHPPQSLPSSLPPPSLSPLSLLPPLPSPSSLSPLSSPPSSLPTP